MQMAEKQAVVDGEEDVCELTKGTKLLNSTQVCTLYKIKKN